MNRPSASVFIDYQCPTGKYPGYVNQTDTGLMIPGRQCSEATPMDEPAPTATGSSGRLSRTLEPRHVTMIALGGIIGAGLFVGSSAAIAAAGPSIVVSYIIAGILVLLIMRMLGEMAVALPEIRSFTEFAREGLGHGAGFVVGWLYWYFWIIVVPVEAIAGAKLLQTWLPLPMWQLGVGLMAAMTAVNLLSARSYGEFEFWFSSIKVAAIIAFIVAAAAFVFGFTSSDSQGLSNLVDHGGFMPMGPLAVLAGVTTVFFSVTGAEITTVAAAESREPARAIAQMTTSIVARILIFYVGSVFLIVCVVPWNLIQPGESPFTRALSQMNVAWGSTAMTFVILTAVLSCLNSAFYVASRVLLVLAEKHDAPAWLVQVNSRRVPTRSVLLGSLAGFAGVAAGILSPSGVFAFLVNASGALILFVYMAIACAQVRLRSTREPLGQWQTPLRMWFFPWASYATIAAMLAVLLAMALTPGLASQFYVSLATLMVVILAYQVKRRRRQGTHQAG